MATQKIIAQIPFDGFYGSVTSWFIDDEIDMLLEETYPDLPYSINFMYLAKEYVKAYKNISGIDSLDFLDLISPREYNFTTDKILCEVSLEDIQKLYTQFIDGGNCQTIIDARFKSRSGFASFYDGFCNGWATKSVEDWDENELFILFPEFDYQELWEDARCNGIFYNAIKIDEAI